MIDIVEAIKIARKSFKEKTFKNLSKEAEPVVDKLEGEIFFIAWHNFPAVVLVSASGIVLKTWLYSK